MSHETHGAADLLLYTPQEAESSWEPSPSAGDSHANLGLSGPMGALSVSGIVGTATGGRATDDGWPEPRADGDTLPDAHGGVQAGDTLEADEAPPDAPYDAANLPPHACAYCGVHNTASVLKCMATGKWFCNGSVGDRGALAAATAAAARAKVSSEDGGDGGGDAPAPSPALPPPSRAGSHIVQHLVRSKHKEVCSHAQSPMGETVLECYNCGTRNVFLLGLIPSSSEGVIVTLCREPCLTLGALKDQGWDLSLWEPLIQDRSFLPWLVPQPSTAEVARSRFVTPAGIAALEFMWRTRPEATYDDLLRADAAGNGPDADASPVLLKYEDGYHYQNVFGPLIKMEADEDKASKAAMRATGLAVRWSRALNRKWTARFAFHRGPESELKLVAGDEMCIKLPSFAGQFAALDALVAQSRHGAAAEDDEGAWSALGFVREVRDGEVVLEISQNSSEITDRLPAAGYTIEIVWRSISFDRMQAALRKFAVDDTSGSGYLYHALLGHPVEPQLLKATLPLSYSAPGLPELNPSQITAVRSVLQRPLSLIQGPPGTGKTVTSATLVYHLSKQGMGQVLVAAPSNVAVDHLAMKIAATGLKVVRVVARSRESITSSVEELCLHNIVIAAAGPKSELRKLTALKAEAGELSAKDGARLRKLVRDAERDVLASADVICTTCAAAGDSHFANMRFQQVLIDEATQAAEPECLIPIVQGCKQLVLVGDHCQLGPVITSKGAATAGLTQSLFERLILLGVRPIRLNVQYRMHPALSEFPSNTFYEGALQNGVTLAERTPAAHEGIGWPIPGRPMFFYISSGAEEMSGSGTSYLNRGEAQAVERVVSHFIKCGVSSTSIGVITPYEGQRAYVTSHLAQNGSLRSSQYADLEIASVDSFQGREKDYVVVSCVRSNDHAGIGFLSDPRRLNVALTRARYGCVIIGNPRVLAKQPLWHLLLSHFKGYGCLVEGPLVALKTSHVHLPAPTKSFVNRTLILPGGRLGEGEGGHAGGGHAAASANEVGATAIEALPYVVPAAAHAAAAAAAAAAGTQRGGGGGGPPTLPPNLLGMGLGGALAAHWPALVSVAGAGGGSAHGHGDAGGMSSATRQPPTNTNQKRTTTRVKPTGRALAEFTSLSFPSNRAREAAAASAIANAGATVAVTAAVAVGGSPATTSTSTGGAVKGEATPSAANP